MFFNLKFDPESSKISEKLVFICDNHELSREDITELKRDKLIHSIQEEYLPEIITCQILMFIENPKKARIVFFNPEFKLAKEITENYFLNKELIEWSNLNGWFWLEFYIPMDHKWIKLNFSYEK